MPPLTRLARADAAVSHTANGAHAAAFMAAAHAATMADVSPAEAADVALVGTGSVPLGTMTPGTTITSIAS